MKSSYYFRTDNISTESLFNVLFKKLLSYEIEVGTNEKIANI